MRENFSPDPFLNELWGDKIEQEQGRDFDERENHEYQRAIEIYERMRLAMEGRKGKKDLAKKLLDGINRSVFNYLAAIDRFSLEKLSLTKDPGSKESREEADLARRRSHDVLIDNLNIFSRYCNNYGIDNSWRSMLGLHRKEVTEWALQIGPYLSKIELEKEGR